MTIALSADDLWTKQRQLYTALEQRLLSAPERWAPNTEEKAALEALDAACKQRDCLLSRLQWHTDFAEAKALAKSQHRPILALYLLGRLDETLSCANSRYFRALLYSDPAIAKYLSSHYVLYWQTVRPAPRISIDFGDGRKLETTITGNSLHYVLDESGTPLDALPGLQSPQRFLAWLTSLSELASSAPSERTLREFHRRALEDLQRSWAREAMKPEWTLPLPLPRVEAPSAADAAPFAVGKMMMQAPMVNALAPVDERLAPATVKQDPVWQRLAFIELPRVAFDPRSMALMRSQHPETGGGSWPQILERFRLSVAEDSVWNEYAFHARIHVWFQSAAMPSDALSLNERIYSELFLTPASDPWLGLRRADAFTGVPNNGIGP